MSLSFQFHSFLLRQPLRFRFSWHRVCVCVWDDLCVLLLCVIVSAFRSFCSSRPALQSHPKSFCLYRHCKIEKENSRRNTLNWKEREEQKKKNGKVHTFVANEYAFFAHTFTRIICPTCAVCIRFYFVLSLCLSSTKKGSQLWLSLCAPLSGIKNYYFVIVARCAPVASSEERNAMQNSVEKLLTANTHTFFRTFNCVLCNLLCFFFFFFFSYFFLAFPLSFVHVLIASTTAWLLLLSKCSYRIFLLPIHSFVRSLLRQPLCSAYVLLKSCIIPSRGKNIPLDFLRKKKKCITFILHENL